MAQNDRRDTVIRLLIACTVLLGGYVALCVWSSQNLPSSVAVGGIQIGGLSPQEAKTAINKGSRSILATPIAVSVPGAEQGLDVVPSEAGFVVDAERSLEGLTGFTLNPATVWSKLTGEVEAPLLTTADDDRLTTYLNGRAAEVAVAAKEGTVTFPQGKVTVSMPQPGRSLDIAGTKLALRQAFPEATAAVAVVQTVAPTVSDEAVQRAASEFGAKAMSGPITLVAGATTTQLTPVEFAPAVSMVADGKGALVPKFDEARLKSLVKGKARFAMTAAKDAYWVFQGGRPKLVPAVNGSAIDEATVPPLVAAAMTSDTRRVDLKPVVTKAKFSTEAAQQAGVKELIVDFRSPFPPEDTTRTNNLVVATRTINGTYIPPGGTFSLNGILGERTTAKGYQDGTVIINGRLTRGTGGGISQVSTTIYNMAYFAGVDTLEFTPHSFFIPRYPEGREATVFWPHVDNKWKNDTPHGILLQTWVEGSYVRGRVWSTKNWDITSVKGPRRNVTPPKDIRDDSLTCYPQQPQPGFDVTVTRQWRKPGSPVLVKSEVVRTHYIPEDKVTCTNPDAKP